MRLHLKFAADASAQQRTHVGVTARRLGADDVRPLFPEADGELGTLYMVDVPDELDGEAIAETLRDHAAVESVEPEPPRWLAGSARRPP